MRHWMTRAAAAFRLVLPGRDYVPVELAHEAGEGFAADVVVVSDQGAVGAQIPHQGVGISVLARLARDVLEQAGTAESAAPAFRQHHRARLAVFLEERLLRGAFVAGARGLGGQAMREVSRDVPRRMVHGLLLLRRGRT